jgi:hypothetical protein
VVFGAEWESAWPAIGMAVFSCASDSVALVWIDAFADVDAGGSAAKTDAAGGTDVSEFGEELCGAAPMLEGEGVTTVGNGGSMLSLLQAASNRAMADTAMNRDRICMTLPWLSWLRLGLDAAGSGRGFGRAMAVRARHIAIRCASVGFDDRPAQQTMPGPAVVLVLRHAGSNARRARGLFPAGTLCAWIGISVRQRTVRAAETPDDRSGRSALPSAVALFTDTSTTHDTGPPALPRHRRSTRGPQRGAREES